MSALAVEVERMVREFVASEIECQTVRDEPSRVGCVMPLQYGDGDSIVVWVEHWGDQFVVSDYGEAFMPAASRAPRDQTDFFAQAESLCAPFGVRVANGILSVQVDAKCLGDAAWRVATAAATVHHHASGFRRPRQHQDTPSYFVTEVERELLNRKLHVERNVKLEGSSGHPHRATIFVPESESILEPIEAAAHYNRISSVYAKFGDLSHANGYRRWSLIDDRHDTLSDDLAAMLIQVSDVIRWSRRDEWIDRVR